MGVRFEITTEPGTVAPGDLVVLRLVTQKGGVKWTCGLFEWLGVPERVGAWLGGDRR